MPIGVIYWVLMILWAIFGGLLASGSTLVPMWSGAMLLFVLFFLLGWKCFGFVVQGPGPPPA